MRDFSMFRKCSYCGQNGHNSRTCNYMMERNSIKLFGVRIHAPDDESHRGFGSDQVRKSKSMGNLEACNNNNSVETSVNVDAGYLSDGPRIDNKKGKAWTEDEHRSFLIGLDRLGKGDWKGISQAFVPTRTPTQVASHAQKYFLRRAVIERRKRRPSVFDMSLTVRDLAKRSAKQSSQASAASSSNTRTTETTGALQEVATQNEPRELMNIDPKGKGEEVSHKVPVSSSDKPPLSPGSRTLGVPDFPRTSPMVGNSSGVQGRLPTPITMPTMSFYPVINCGNQNLVYLPNVPGNFATATPIMPQSIRNVEAPPPSTINVQSQATLAPAAPTLAAAAKDGLELSLGVGALAL